jgi:hypothetical protein
VLRVTYVPDVGVLVGDGYHSYLLRRTDNHASVQCDNVIVCSIFNYLRADMERQKIKTINDHRYVGYSRYNFNQHFFHLVQR